LLMSLFVIIILGSVSYAQMGEWGNRSNMREMIKKKLQLTPEQEKKISELRLNHQERMIDLTAEIKKKELAKEKVLSSDLIQRDDMLKITKDIQDIKNQIEIENVNHQMDIYSLLDANQRQTWKDMMLKKDRMKFRMTDRMRSETRNGMNDRRKDRMENPE
jgi:hypothetical protein